MNPFSFIFQKISLLYHAVIYQPLLNGLYFIYAVIPYHDLGLAIIVLTVAVRLILHRSTVQTLRSQKAMAAIQPRLKEIQQRFKDNKEEQTKQTLALYREHGVHPLSGCLPILVQFPVLFGLFQVFYRGITSNGETLLYSFIPDVGPFNPISFGLFDLASRSIVLSIAAGLSQFVQTKMMNKMTAGPAAGKTGDFANALKFQTTYFLPLVIAGISWSLPSAVALYWTIFNILAIVQQLWIQRIFENERSPSALKSNTGENGHSGRS